MQMANEFDHGVIFYETVLSLKSQRHTVIEAVPVPWKVYEDAPGYFKVRASRFKARLNLSYLGFFWSLGKHPHG